MNPTSPAASVPQQAVTMAAGLGEERVLTTVKFAITGVPASDLIAGIHALLEQCTMSHRQQQYVFEMMTKMAKEMADEADRQTAEFTRQFVEKAESVNKPGWSIATLPPDPRW